MNPSKPARGAESAYYGYRWQFTYTLHRILSSTENQGNLVFQPEGDEDLAIYNTSGELLEAIQVKTEPDLKLSSLSNNDSQKESFFRRAVERIKKHPQAKTSTPNRR